MEKFLRIRIPNYNKKALAINIIENDSLYIHADTLVGTGPLIKEF